MENKRIIEKMKMGAKTMTNIFVRLKQTRLRNRVLAAVLACAVVLSAAAAVTIPLINAPKAVGEKPGTTTYYNARGEDAKTQVGKVTVGTTDTDY